MPDQILATLADYGKENEELRIAINEFKGKKYLSIRVWFLSLDDNQWHPGKNGINIEIERAEEILTLAKKGFTDLYTKKKK